MVNKGRSGRAPLTEREKITVKGAERLPLTSAQNLASLTGEDYRRTLDSLDDVLERRLVGELKVGLVQKQQPRYYRGGRGPAATHGGPRPKHPGLIAALLTRPALMESVYTVTANALAANPGWRIIDLQWRFDDVADAVVRLNHGWIAFKWSGIWQTQRRLVEHLDSLHDHLARWNPRGRIPLPGTISFIAADSWQVEVVRRAVRAGNWAGRHMIHNAATGETEGDVDLSNSVGKPPKPDMKRWLGEPDRLDTIVETLMIHEHSKYLIRVMNIIEQWPAAVQPTLRQISRLNGRLLTKALTALIDQDLVWLTSNGGYAPQKDCLSIAARRDRVWAGRPSRMFGPDKITEYYAGRIADHERGLAALVGKFAAAGCEVAPGWRHREDMGKLGQIAPDAMVYVPVSPFGPGWHYLEYELSRTSPSGARRKVRPYRSPRRGDDFPVLVATRRKAVNNYIEASRGMRVLVAAVEDLRRGKVIGESGTVWQNTDGQQVQRFGKWRRV